ncbi:hypothetical protein Tco_0961886 [Tanacetum coccineum]
MRPSTMDDEKYGLLALMLPLLERTFKTREDMEDENVLGKQLKNGDEVVVEMKLLIKLVENRNKSQQTAEHEECQDQDKRRLSKSQKNRLCKEKAQQVEEANIAWDDIQAKIDDDYQLAKRLHAQEQHELTIKEKSILFIQLLEKRKKHFVAKRAEEKRNKPPTRAQQRIIMCTYLKNMAGWKPKDLNNKSFTNIQELFAKLSRG